MPETTALILGPGGDKLKKTNDVEEWEERKSLIIRRRS